MRNIKIRYRKTIHKNAWMENARRENVGNTEYGKPRLYKHVKMYVVCSSVSICNRVPTLNNELENNCPRSRIEVRPTALRALSRSYALDIDP